MREIDIRENRTSKMSSVSKIAFSALAVIALFTTSVATGAAARKNWLLTISFSDQGGHIIGNPAAPNKVVEYLSYTCGHCASFENSESAPFKAQYVATGKASLEIRNYVLNALDLTAAMLARCGGKGRFFGNQKHLFATQNAWLSKSGNISAATQAKLKAQDYAGFMTGVYVEIGLAKIMQQRGIALAQGKACLADPDALRLILAMADKGNELGVNGTPTFFVNGEIQPDVHDFKSLKSKLN